MSGKLILVGTPIGNLSDMTPRAIDALENCDFIAAEDTRVTSKLLNHFNISKPLISYYEHNKFQKSDYIIERIQNGETCALCSDAGMPIISDPGDELVRLAYENGIEVTSTPGPTAAMTALVLSGITSKRFTFEGFLSTNKKNRREHLQSLVNEQRTMVFYEAPHKLKNTLADMYEYFGDRELSICRELTKLFEEINKTTLKQAIEKYETTIPKGEFVLVIKGCDEKKTEISLAEAVDMAKSLISDGASALAAAKDIASETGLKKSDIYNEIQRNK